MANVLRRRDADAGPGRRTCNGMDASSAAMRTACVLPTPGGPERRRVGVGGTNIRSESGGGVARKRRTALRAAVGAMGEEEDLEASIRGKGEWLASVKLKA